MITLRLEEPPAVKTVPRGARLGVLDQKWGRGWHLQTQQYSVCRHRRAGLNRPTTMATPVS